MTENSARILAALFYGLGLPAVGPMHDRRGLAGQRTAIRYLINKGALRPDLTVTDNGVRLLADYLRGCNHD